MKYNILLLLLAGLLVRTQIYAQDTTAGRGVDTVITRVKIYMPPSDRIVFDDFDYEEDVDEEQVFVSVEQMPEFPGGMEALRKYIADHIKYPEIAKENEIEGTVVVKFIINRDGTVSKVSVLRGVDPVLDSEAVRVVRTLPKFKPGMNCGCPVKVWFTLPVVFKLQK